MFTPIFLFFTVMSIPQYVLQVPVIVPVASPAPIQAEPPFDYRPRKQTRTTAYVDAKDHPVSNKLSEFIPKVQSYSIPGERSKVVVAFKCPSEVATNIETPASRAIHRFADMGFNMVNYAKFIPFTLEQACT